jgi:hypothetical protein
VSRLKDIFIEQHERLFGEYLDAHPEANEEDAYDATGGAAYDALGDHFADMADHYRDLAKEGK